MLKFNQNCLFHANSSHFSDKIGHCGSFWTTLVGNNSKRKLANELPPPPEQKFLRFLQKWDTLVAKDRKSCESSELGHSESIWASFWGKRWENMQNDQNWPFWANLSPFFGKIRHCASFWAASVWNDFQKFKNSKMFQCNPPHQGLKKIFKKLNDGYWITFNFWWLVERSEWQKLTKMKLKILSTILINSPKTNYNHFQHKSHKVQHKIWANFLLMALAWINLSGSEN